MQPKVGKTKKQIKQIVGAARNKKRVDLSKQFQQFKQRIQQFQNKNEEIISRIRDAYSTKKRAVTGKESSPNTNPASQVLYKNYNDGESVNSSCDYSKNMVLEGNMIRAQPYQQIPPVYTSNIEEYENGQKQRVPQYKSTQQLVSNNSIRSSNIMPTAANQASYEDYMRNVRLRTEEDDVPSGSRGVEAQTVHLPYPDEDHFAELEEKYKEEIIRNQQLEEMLHMKQEEMAKLKNQQLRFKSYSNNLKHVVEDGLQAYQEQVVAERFLQLQKYMRKCELRLKNLSLRLKDSLEEKRSRRIIHKSRSKRNSISRNKKESSMSEQAESTPKISRACSQSKAKNRNENPGKHKEFQQIAGDYENMIKAKVQEIENLQRRVNEETSAKELTANELAKCKALLQEKEKELNNLKRMRKPVKEEPSDGRELKQLKERITKLEEEITAKDHREKEMGELIQKLERAKKSQHQEYVENINKNKMLKNKAIQQLQTKLKEMENGNQKLIAELRERVGAADKKSMERECEMMTVLTKLKKVENQCLIKEEKLKELECLLLKENDHGDLLDRSMSMDTSVLSQTEIRHLHQNVRRLEQEVEEGKSTIYDLQKNRHLLESANSEYEGQIALLSRNNAALQLKVSELRRELESTRFEDERDSTRELQEKNELIEEYEAEKELWLQEKEELSTKNGELMEELKKIKENNLTINRELIKTTSQLNFNRNQQSNLQAKLSRCKEELNSQKQRNEELFLEKKQREDQLLTEMATLREEMQNLRNNVLELQTMGSRNNLDNKEEDMLLNSLHVSEMSFNYQPKQVQEQEVAALRERLREVEMMLDIKTGMEEQIQKEYRSNLEILRLDSLQKNKELQRYKTDLELCKAELQKIKGAQKQDDSFQNYKLQVYKEKIVQMQQEYSALKDSQERLNQMLHQIVETVKSRDQQRQRIMRELDEKEKVIEEFKELLEIRQIKQSHNKTMKTDTLKEFSLRISGDHSEELIDTAELSYLSNISDVFKRDDILQDKIKKGKTSREEQVKLFAKTSAYIKSLKAIIETKDKRIKMLEKQISSMKSNENKSWSDKERSLSQRPYYTEQYVEHDDVEECDQYKDYESVQLDTRRSRYHEMVKQLQNQKNLAVEENKLLNKQIEALHDEILRSEEQENSLVRIKDLYKDEIKKLIEKNEIHTKEFQVQIKKLKEELENSESYHNLEAIRQLFVKIVAMIASMEQGSTKRKDQKREEKRKQLDEYLKIMSSILQLQTSPKPNFKK